MSIVEIGFYTNLLTQYEHTEKQARDMLVFCVTWGPFVTSLREYFQPLSIDLRARWVSLIILNVQRRYITGRYDILSDEKTVYPKHVQQSARSEFLFSWRKMLLAPLIQNRESRCRYQDVSHMRIVFLGEYFHRNTTTIHVTCFTCC